MPRNKRKNSRRWATVRNEVHRGYKSRRLNSCNINNTVDELFIHETQCTSTTDDHSSLSLDQSTSTNSDTVPAFYSDELTDQKSDKLREWAVNGNIELIQLSKLLKILVHDGRHKELPLDARTLLRTPRTISIRNMDNGYYVHMGIKDYLNTCFKYFGNDILQLKLTHLELSFNMNGTPISTSGGSHFWPILGSISNVFKHPDVFVVGIFNGPQRPDSYNNYLLEFVEELKDLIEYGYTWNGTIHIIKLKAIICDAPAMAFVKAIKSHEGYHCCSKCYIKGEAVLAGNKIKKIIYPDLHTEARTDETFRARETLTGENDLGHQMNKERSVLEQLAVDMIKTFPVDKMHLVDEGVVKKMMKLWLGKPGTQKLRASQVHTINQRLENCYVYSPIDFQRKPRSLKYAHFLKASECRVFLLYTGPIVLKNVLPKGTYEHFLSLSLAVRLLTSLLYYNKYNDYAHSLLIYFVKNFIKLYGKQNASYNIHGLLHLAEDAKHLGPLDENSCYIYEAFIKIMKKKLHSFNRPLQQCSNRINELRKLHVNNPEFKNKIKMHIAHSYKPELTHSIGGNKFMTALYATFKIRANHQSDNCVMLHSNTIIRVKCFDKQGSVITEGQVFIKTSAISRINQDLYEKFFFIGTFKNEIIKVSLTNDPILCKMCCLPNDVNTFLWYL